MVVASVRVRPGMDAEFAAWKASHDAVIGRFPGFVGSDIIPPPTGSNQWTIIANFRSPADATAWRESSEHASLVADGARVFEDGRFAESESPRSKGDQTDASVTEVIFSKVKPGMEDTYREWAARIQAAQARYPGYRGMYLQPPDEPGGFWTTIIRFDSAASLEGWMNAPERKELLRESRAFIEQEQLTRLATAFPGWVPIDPVTGKGPAAWKTALLVLLGLFPVVMLELRFLSPRLAAAGIHASLATFIGNALSVALTSFGTMPLLVRWFGWWLFPATGSPNTTLRGVLLVTALFAVEIAAFWKLLPW